MALKKTSRGRILLLLALLELIGTPHAVLSEMLRLPDVQHPLFYISHGITCVDTIGDVVTGQDTVDGDVIIRQVTKDPITVVATTAPALVGIGVGVSFGVAAGTPRMELLASVTHPPMGEKRITRQTWPIMITGGDIKGIGYRLEDAFEEFVVPWTFQLHQGDSQLLQMTFDMVEEGSMPDLENACFGDLKTGF